MLPLDKLASLARRYRELEDMLCRAEIVADRQQFQRLSKERSELEPITAAYQRLPSRMTCVSRLWPSRIA